MPPSLLIQEQGSITGGHRRLFSYIVSVIHIHYWRPSRAPLGELTFESSDTSSAVGSRVTSATQNEIYPSVLVQSALCNFVKETLTKEG